MLKNARLNTKISVCFSLLLAFITAVACVVLAEFYRDSSLRQSGLLLQTVGDAAVQQLEMTFDEIDRISARLFFSSEISEAMKDAAASTGQSEYFEEHYSMQDTVRSRIFSIVSTSNSDTTVNLYNRNAFISNRYTQCFWNRIQTSMEDGLLAQLDEELGGANTAVLSGPHDAYWTTDYYDSNSYISLTRNYINYNTKKVLGKVQILKRVEKLQLCCEVSTSDQAICVFDQEGTLLLSSAKALQADIDAAAGCLESLRAGQSGQLHKAADAQYLYAVSRSDKWGLYAVALQPYSDRVLFPYIALVVLCGVLLCALSIGFGLFISHRLTKPLSELVDSLQSLSWTDSENGLQISFRGGDLQFLEDAYNAITEKLKSTTNQMLEARLNEQEASYLALQSQISPHFIYNIISNISACAYNGETQTVIRLCDSFSQLLRYAADYSGLFGTIQTELQYTTCYMELMQIRYSDGFFFQTSCQPDCADIPLPRMLIQTIVENCFKHGFRDTPQPWFINIRVFSEQKQWMIEIQDNGTALPQETLNDTLEKSEQIYRSILDGRSHLHLGGLGLLNSITRLRLLDNNNISFTVETKDGVSITRVGGQLL